MVENIVAIELSYVNTKHPDFQRETAMVGSLMATDCLRSSTPPSTASNRSQPIKNRPLMQQQQQQPQQILTNGDNKENAVANGPVNSNTWISNLLPAPKNEGQQSQGSKNETESVSSQQSKEASPANTPLRPPGSDSTVHVANIPNLHSPQKAVNLLPEVPESANSSGRKLSDREKRDCEVIGNLNFFKFSQDFKSHCTAVSLLFQSV